MSVRWWTLAVWALAAASALGWGLKLFVKPQPVPPQAQLAAPGAAAGDLTRLLGAEAPPVVVAAAEPVADSRFKLIGVVSPRSPRAADEGLALIAVDGKPPRAYRVGAVVDGTQVLRSVDARGVTIASKGSSDSGVAPISLTLPPLASAATGTLRPAGAGAFVPPMPMPTPMPAAVPSPSPSPTPPPPGAPPMMVAPPPYVPKALQPQPQPHAPQFQTQIQQPASDDSEPPPNFGVRNSNTR